MNVLEKSKTSVAPARAGQVVAGIAAGTLILTATGEKPVETLQPGERIITRDGIRKLRSLAKTAFSGVSIEIAPSALGHARPETRLVLGAAQMLYLRDWRAEALFGTPTALVPSARLVDGEHVVDFLVEDLDLYNLAFDGPCVIYAAGLELAFNA